MGGLVMAIVASKLWANPSLPAWYRGEASAEFAHETEHSVAMIWRMLAQPLLFGVIGTVVDFRVLEVASIPKALVVVNSLSWFFALRVGAVSAAQCREPCMSIEQLT